MLIFIVKKKGTIAKKKSQIPKSLHENRQSKWFFVTMNVVTQCLAPTVSYFARMDKSETLLKSIENCSLAKKSGFAGVIDPKPN